jgi:hypothetical protein
MKPLSNGKISQVQDLLRSQMSFRQIKDRTGVSLGSISSIRKALPDVATKKKKEDLASCQSAMFEKFAGLPTNFESITLCRLQL